MCNYPECLEGVKFGPEGGVIQVGYGYIDERPFSVLIRDSRQGGQEHLHFPAADLEAFARHALHASREAR